jgi:predicted phosphodiesterase
VHGILGVLGDIHADWESVRSIMRRHVEVPAWLCVGDLGNDDGIYEDVPAPIYWIKGNNESFDRIAEGSLPSQLRYLPNAVPREVGGARVLGVGGTFAPTWYDTDPGALPHPRKGTMKATVLADKRRHFVRAEVEAAKAAGRVDVLLTHEAPRPFRVGRMDAGKTPINELIAALRPRFHFFGHHHRFAELEVSGIRSVGLDLVGTSYVLVDTREWRYERLVSW